MQNQTDCYEYGRRIKGYLDNIDKAVVNTSFNKIRKAVGVPEDAVGIISLYSVPTYRTDFDPGSDQVSFTRVNHNKVVRDVDLIPHG